jgi:hypothetical protein
MFPSGIALHSQISSHLVNRTPPYFLVPIQKFFTFLWTVPMLLRISLPWFVCLWSSLDFTGSYWTSSSEIWGTILRRGAQHMSWGQSPVWVTHPSLWKIKCIPVHGHLTSCWTMVEVHSFSFSVNIFFYQIGFRSTREGEHSCLPTDQRIHGMQPRNSKENLVTFS